MSSFKSYIVTGINTAGKYKCLANQHYNMDWFFSIIVKVWIALPLCYHVNAYEFCCYTYY